MNPNVPTEAAECLSQDASSDWWRTACIYQIYIRSFADGNGDGTGDLAGIRSRLPYLAELGVDALWINPWYQSPLLDGGYDVADYRRIDPRYGTTDEAELFIAEAADLGIRVLVDLVPNHSSWEHAWFVEALASPPGSAARDRYHFCPGQGANGEQPPNNWQSVFGGPAWTQVDDGEWYLHLFDTSQPDFNWEHPEVKDEFIDILRFWLDRGAAGFRVDVAHSLVKAPGYPDEAEAARATNDHPAVGPDHPFWDRDEIHPIVRTWRQVLDEYDDRMMVAEAWVSPERRPLYVREGEYHQAFQFDLVTARWDVEQFRRVIAQGVEAAVSVGAVPTWVLSNHDVVRHTTRYGLPTDADLDRWSLTGPAELLDEARGNRRARAAILIMLALPGSVYLYQGEELGLPEAWDLPLELLDDPIWEKSGRTQKGRDGCRVPIPWESTGPSLGFGDAEPWLPQPASFAKLAVSEQDSDSHSMLSLYRAALAIRSRQPASEVQLEMLDLGFEAGVQALAFTSRGLRCVVNMGADPLPMPEGEVVLCSGELSDDSAAGRVLPSDTTVWMA